MSRIDRVGNDALHSPLVAEWSTRSQHGGRGSIGPDLAAALSSDRWTSFRAAVAFAKRSGVRHLAGPLFNFAQRPETTVKISIGISSQGTSLEGLQDLWRVTANQGEIFVFHEGAAAGSFHPKLYLFESDSEALAVVGSSNLTEGGLFSNHEVSVVGSLTTGADDPMINELRAALDYWQMSGDNCKLVTPALMQELHDQGDLPSEQQMSAGVAASRSATRGASRPQRRVEFRSSGGDRPPAPPPFPPGAADPAVEPTTARRGGSTSDSTTEEVDRSNEGEADESQTQSGASSHTSSGGSSTGSTLRQFVIEVRPHHNGEVFLSYRAVNGRPDFFQYPYSGRSVPKSARGRSYPAMDPDPTVEILVFDNTGAERHRKQSHPLNVVDYEPKREIRITVPDGWQRDIPQMSVLVMTEQPDSTHDYRLEFYPPGSAGAGRFEPFLTESLPTGGAAVGRRFGWTSVQT